MKQNFSPTIPVANKRPSILDPYKEVIDGYLDEDERSWHKQRHTAKRIYERLVEEHDAQVGYTTVQLYVKKRRAERKTPKDVLLKLVWVPGEAQVDFGENAECVCQGLINVFNYVGGVPVRPVFDDATGVGRRIGEIIKTSELFGRFSCHFGFDYSFCNPRSGHEKGVVENKVGTIRRNLFVPIPQIYNVEKYNKRLLNDCMKRADKDHYAKGESERALFVEDTFALRELPECEFRVMSFEYMRCDKCGYVCLEGNHRYAIEPAFANRSAIVGRGAFDIEIYDEDGAHLCTLVRAYGKAPTSSDDPLSQLNVLCLKPRGWQNSQVRYSLPDDLREAMDKMEMAERSDVLRCLRDDAHESGYGNTVKAMSESLALLGKVDRASVEVMATCAHNKREQIIYDDPADLDVYDAVYSQGGDA